MATVGRAALTHRDDGSFIGSPTSQGGDDWVSASRTRNFCEEDPLLDWLDMYGAQHGFIRDDEDDAYDWRTDLRLFLFERGRLFEEGVVRLIRDQFEVVPIARGREDVRAAAKAEETLQAMQAGIPIIEQAVLHNPENLTYGAVDLLVRSDVMNQLVPDCVGSDEAQISAPALGHPQWHYRAIDIKFHTLHLLRDGRAASSMLPFMVQVWIYNKALSRVQGYLPPAAFLLGRCWIQGEDRGLGCFERLARVEHSLILKDGRTLSEIAADAIEWVRRLRRDGASWQVLPEPSVPELYPHARHDRDQPWRTAKSYLARELAELTLLPAVNAAKRRQAHAFGVKRWDEPGLTSDRLDILPIRWAEQCEAVLRANRSQADAAVFPERIAHVDDAWRQAAPLELYVDFETVNNLDDDFTALPEVGGQPLIFQIGCGWWEAGVWRFAQWTADYLTEAAEAVVFDGWIGHMREMLSERGLRWDDARLIHWSPAEWVNLSRAYNSARERHPGRTWPLLRWFDFLNEVICKEPVTVRGAFNFRLKSIASAMHAAGLIETVWRDGPVDGLGAMAGGWWCAGEAARSGVSMRNLELMKQIGAYNEVDCRAMAEIVAWLRANR
jgi:hypothetical protein